MKKSLGSRDFLMDRVFRMARHSVVIEEADKGILLENLMERLEKF